MKSLRQLTIALMLTTLTAYGANDMDKYIPANWGGWKNLSCSVNDTTYYTSDQLPMQAAVSGQTIHVFWPDWKPNSQGESSIYYRRSADGGKTWEDARALVKSKNMSMVDINYVGGSIGSNSKWYEVQGQNVHLVTVIKSDDENNSELLYTYSHDGGKTFQQSVLAKGSEGDGHFFFGRPHVVSDGQTLVIAFQNSRNNSTNYKTRVLTSFDGGSTFTDKEIETTQELVDVKVSGRRWTVLGNDMYWNYNMWWGNVYLSTSTDGGNTITTQNIAPLVKDDTSWCHLEYMKGYNGASFNYHPQMTLEGDVINVIFRGCAEEIEGTSPTNDRSHTIFRRSTDGGKTWTKAMYLPGTTGTDGAIAAKGQNIYVLQMPNGPKIWHSHDGGQTWDVQERCYWDGRYDGYGNFYELYIAPDDATGQHVYLTGCRALLVETKDGFRTVNRNFVLGTESWYGGRSNNHSLTVLLDSEGTEHWLMNYQAPYKNFDPHFWNIVYRRNDPASATTGKEMAFDISKRVYAELTQKIVNNITIPMTPSIMATQDAITVECWIRVDETDYSFEIASMTNSSASHAGSQYNGGWYIHTNKSGDWYNFYAGLSTEYSVDGKGKEIWDRWRYQIKEFGFWHHVALTYDSKQEKDNLCFYVDGVLMGTATDKGKISMGNNPIVIGRTSTYGEKQKAMVDNFAIWSRALTQEEIQTHIHNTPDAKDKDCRLLLTFDGSLQDQSQYHNDPAPLMDAILVEHDGIRAPHPEFTLTKDMNGQMVYGNDITRDGEASWWILPYPGYPNSYETSENRHVTRNFNRYPGTYTFTMVAKGTGDYNAYASTTQQITIAGLSRVYPAEAGQSEAVKLRIQGGYELTYYKKPKVMLKQGTTEIEGTWDVEYGYDASKVSNIDDLAPAIFDLTSAKTGKYDVIVGTDTLYQAFTLEKGEEPDVWLQVNGRGASLWGKYQRYTIDFGNRANVAAYNTPMFLIIPDRHGTIDIQFDFDFDLCDPALDDEAQKMAQQLGEYLMAYDEQTKDSIRVYSFMIPYIGPNSTEQRSFRIKMMQSDSEPSNVIKIGYWVEQPWGPYTPATTRAPYTLEQGECFAKEFGKEVFETAISFIPVASCLWSIGKAGYSTATGLEGKWSTLFTNALDVVMNCAEEAIPGAHAIQGAWKLASMAYNFYGHYSNLKDMKNCLNGDPNSINNQGRGSYDPNEIIGPWGPDEQAHFIKPIHNMAYTVTFENKSTATAPAHEVFVTDTLDATKYDLSTFGFSAYGWADTTLVVGGGLTKEFTRDIAYKVKGQEIKVRVSGQFDEQTGIARWSFVSLMKNGNEIDDPDLGFLLPNDKNHVGEGFVSFSIDHKKDPVNGSTISNKATIVFDANAPITTNTYMNTFDTDYPTSKVTKVEEKDGQLVVTIEGNDATSGIDHYNLYVIKNGGTAELASIVTPGSQATINCDPGTKYGFCSLATDRVGWNEPKNVTAEKEITTSGDSKPTEPEPVTTYTLNIVAAGYATFYDSQKNYTLPAGLKASVVSSHADGRLSYKPLAGNIIPKGTAVLIEATQKKAGTYTLTSTTTSGSAVGTNLLRGSDNTTTTTGNAGSIFYKLAYGPSGTTLSKTFGWFWGTQNGAAFRIEGHRAWLAIPQLAAARAYLVSGEATGIEEISAETESLPYTDLQGRRVKEPKQPGIYIKNGRKVVIK